MNKSLNTLLPTKEKRDMVKVILDFGSAIPLKALHTTQASFFALKSAECLPLWARYFDISLGKWRTACYYFISDDRTHDGFWVRAALDFLLTSLVMKRDGKAFSTQHLQSVSFIVD
jgi:hypothetical protein